MEFEEIIANFPERKREISNLCSFLDKDLLPSQPILIYGPSATGKTSICTALLEKMGVPFIRIICAGYPSSKYLFKAIYDSAQAALLRQSTELHIAMEQRVVAATYGPPCTREKRSRVKDRRINTLSDLCVALSELLPASSCDSADAGDSTALYIMLRSVASADAYEKGLSPRLLNLAEISNCNLKIIAIASDSDNIPSSCIPIKFPQYDGGQVEKIILFRANKEWFNEVVVLEIIAAYHR